jgi:hypothetical protein
MRHADRALVFALAAAALPPAASAQDDEILLIEREVDRSGRDRLLAKLRPVRVTLRADELPARELARHLSAAAGELATFVPFTKGEIADMPALTTDVGELAFPQALAVITRLTTLRFVFRAGLVLVKQNDEVDELLILRIYDVSAAVAPLRDRPGPRLGLEPPGVETTEEEEGESGKTLSGFTIEKIEDLVRTHVAPDSWDDGRATLRSMNGTLWVRQTDANQRRVAELLATLGVIPPAVPAARPRRATPPAPSRASGAGERSKGAPEPAPAKAPPRRR